MFRKPLITAAAVFALALPMFAQTADEIMANYVKAVGGMDKIKTIKTLRTTGKLSAPGGFEAPVMEEKKRPNLDRQELTFQGQTQVQAYDGKNGWKIDPFQGKKDPEALSEEELKGVLDDASFDDVLTDPKANDATVEFVGKEPVEGTDAYKLKVTRAKTGTVQYYYLDTDANLPIKVETKRMIRGAERELETIIGDYKQFDGMTIPTSFEFGVKGKPDQRQKVTIEKVEFNVPIDDSRFKMPAAAAAPAPKAEEKKEPPKTEEKKK